MIRQLLVLLILIIGQCIIAMELPKVVEASENPLHGIDTSARISELHSAPDPPSSNQLSTSSASLQTLDDLQKDNPPRLDNQKEEHRISIPDAVQTIDGSRSQKCLKPCIKHSTQ
ncbi:hypothetical protein Pst134EB_012639 [Puccinia striiformis f. sp. tritici]|nr:hypothetical protein Pst134EB_012639 [Puccinia striiformis f. sp. tritici]